MIINSFPNITKYNQNFAQNFLYKSNSYRYQFILLYTSFIFDCFLKVFAK